MGRKKKQVGLERISDYPIIPVKLDPDTWMAVRQLAVINGRSACAQLRLLAQEFVEANKHQL